METSYTVDEDAGLQHVCVELTGELETSISVIVHTECNTALGTHTGWYMPFHTICIVDASPTSWCNILTAEQLLPCMRTI